MDYNASLWDYGWEQERNSHWSQGAYNLGEAMDTVMATIFVNVTEPWSAQIRGLTLFWACL